MNEKIRPSIEDFQELSVSFEPSKRSFWEIAGDFASRQNDSFVVSIVSLAVCGIACWCVEDSWAAFGIVVSIIAFSVFAVIYAQKEFSQNESGNESGNQTEAGKNQLRNIGESLPSGKAIRSDL